MFKAVFLTFAKTWRQPKRPSMAERTSNGLSRWCNMMQPQQGRRCWHTPPHRWTLRAFSETSQSYKDMVVTVAPHFECIYAAGLYTYKWRRRFIFYHMYFTTIKKILEKIPISSLHWQLLKSMHPHQGPLLTFIPEYLAITSTSPARRTGTSKRIWPNTLPMGCSQGFAPPPVFLKSIPGTALLPVTQGENPESPRTAR